MVVVCNYALFVPLISILMAQVPFGTFRRRRCVGFGTVCTFLAHHDSFLYTWVVFWIRMHFIKHLGIALFHKFWPLVDRSTF